jgi:uncharacterized metal-binding protein
MEDDLMCALCKLQYCNVEPGTKTLPNYCPMADGSAEGRAILDEARTFYFEDEQDRKIALAAARVEAEGYLKWPRLQEVMAFARRIGAEHLGIASCIGLIEEARMLQDILSRNGFQVSSVCCKVGSISKLEAGLKLEETLNPDGTFDPLCNPAAQARLLDAAGSQLNIVVGLCVGHDTLFFRHTQTPTTVLIAKDRVTGHNPVAALYTSHSYYQRLKTLYADEDE